MANSVLQLRSKEFAVEIIKLAKELQEKHNFVLANQILKSGTSIGANVAEGAYGASKADFINKFTIAQKEASETKYWLELLMASELIEHDMYTRLSNKLDSLLSMLAKSIITARKGEKNDSN